MRVPNRYRCVPLHRRHILARVGGIWSSIRSLFWLLCTSATLLAPDPASAHAYVETSVPADRSTLAHAPTEVRIRFSETVELAFSSITVKSLRGKIVSRGALRNPIPNTLTIARRRAPARRGADAEHCGDDGSDAGRAAGGLPGRQ